MQVKLTIPSVKLGRTTTNVLSIMTQRSLSDLFGSTLRNVETARLENGALIERVLVDLAEAPQEVSIDLGALGRIGLAGDGTPDARLLRLLLPLGLSGWVRDSLKPVREERALRRHLSRPHYLFWLALKPGQIVTLPFPQGAISVELQ